MALSESALRILTLLRNGPRQAQDLAEVIGIDTSAVRRQLHLLEVEGHVERKDVVAGRGRPKAHYTLTSAGWEQFPRDYALLLEPLLAKIREEDGPEALKRKLTGIAGDLAAAVPAAGPGTSRLQVLVDFYNHLGFEATVETTPDGLHLVQRNCILLRAAKQDPEALCECFDEGIIRAALPGTTPRLLSCMATGDTLCRHSLDATP